MKNQQIKSINDINRYKLEKLLNPNNFQLLSKQDRIQLINSKQTINQTLIYGLIISGSSLILLNQINLKIPFIFKHLLRFSLISSMALITANLHNKTIFNKTNKNFSILFEEYSILVKNTNNRDTISVYNNRTIDIAFDKIYSYNLTSVYFVYLLIVNSFI